MKIKFFFFLFISFAVPLYGMQKGYKQFKKIKFPTRYFSSGKNIVTDPRYYAQVQGDDLPKPINVSKFGIKNTKYKTQVNFPNKVRQYSTGITNDKKGTGYFNLKIDNDKDKIAASRIYTSKHRWTLRDQMYWEFNKLYQIRPNASVNDIIRVAIKNAVEHERQEIPELALAHWTTYKDLPLEYYTRAIGKRLDDELIYIENQLKTGQLQEDLVKKYEK